MAQALTPYARALGIRILEETGGPTASGEAPLCTVEFTDQVEGRPGAMHGGAIGGLLEAAGYAALAAALADAGRSAGLKPVNITVQYLTTGRPQPSFARGRVVRLGRRTANLAIDAWQDNPHRVIASAVMNVLLSDQEY